MWKCHLVLIKRTVVSHSVPPASFYMKEVDWLWNPLKFYGRWKTLSLGGWHGGWDKFPSWSLSDPAAVQCHTFDMYTCKGMHEVCTCDSHVIKSALIRLPTLINHDPQASDYSPIPHLSSPDLIHFRCLTWKQWLIPSPEYADLKMPPNKRLCSGCWVKLGHSVEMWW